MKKLFLLAWPIALAAVSCSNEEVVSVNNDANEIKFAVVAENGTRAQNLFCNITKPTNFHVWAAVGDSPAAKQYFANASFTNNGGTFYIDTDHRYWPEAGTMVDFYAVTEQTAKATDEYEGWTGDYSTDTRAFGWNPNAASTIKWETRNLEAPSQTDLLYAYTRASRPTNGGTVDINFRHALSQIVFKAKNTNTTIDVEIDKVEVVNIAKGGVFTMPYGAANVTTLQPVVNHETNGTYPTAGVGSWNIQDVNKNTSADQTYTTTQFGPVHVTAAGDNLTEETMGASTHENFGLSLLLVPQTTKAWARTETATKDPDATGQTGSYFKVYCRIKNVSGVEGGADLYLWGSDAKTEAVYIPFAANWAPGKKYIYTFNFGGDTTGGYDEDGDPVLIPISFKITVDDFVKVDNNVDMK